VFVVRSQRYALDVNVERVEDTLTHQRLLEEAQYLQDRLALAVGVFQVMWFSVEHISASCTEHVPLLCIISSWIN
jgi:hypothetical protein